MYSRLSGDRLFALIVMILVVGGAAMFLSAALGLLAREGSSIAHIALTQLALGLIPGVIALFILRFIDQKILIRSILPFYLLALIATALVFIPGLGVHTNGAARWIAIGPLTLQPAEFLKIATILMLASYLAHAKTKIKDWKHGLLAFSIIVGIPALLLLAQPNTSTTLLIGVTSVAMYILAGAPKRDIALIIAVAIIGLGTLVFMRPYLMNRVMTFVHPAQGALTTGYQIQQSLIAIGSGKIVGRGFGQSVQKFNYLPEPVGDSIFAVYGEEFGFIGTVLLVLLFTAFATRGFMLAAESATAFGTFATMGLTFLISLAAFMNISAMLGIMPLTGLPLPFISHGGTALLAALASVGIILNIAAHRPKPKH